MHACSNFNDWLLMRPLFGLGGGCHLSNLMQGKKSVRFAISIDNSTSDNRLSKGGAVNSAGFCWALKQTVIRWSGLGLTSEIANHHRSSASQIPTPLCRLCLS